MTLQELEEMQRLEGELRDAEKYSVEAEKALIDAQDMAEKAHRAKLNAQRALNRYRVEYGV